MSDNVKRFPDHPGFKEKGGTSEAAADMMKPKAPDLRQRCLAIIAAAPAGLTACEVARLMDWELCSIRARISELYAKGKVEKSGSRRGHAGTHVAVWKLAEPEAKAA